jgi:hypothetical protein
MISAQVEAISLLPLLEAFDAKKSIAPEIYNEQYFQHFEHLPI